MSDQYRALTRTYRPVHFEDIVAQEHVSDTLKNAIAGNRLSHAYLFCGPRGVGKTTMARVLARAINDIDDQVDGEALSNTLNIIEIDAASNNKVDDVHRIRETVRIPPQNGRYKIYIVDEVHMLSKQAFNALLKTLEEPPPHAIFIFATTEPHKVLPTILSRCQRFDFRRIKVEEIVERLRLISQKEGLSVDNESLHLIARKADGALRDALGLMDQAIAFCGTTITYDALKRALNAIGLDRMFELMKFVVKQDADGGMQLIAHMLQEGYDLQEFLVELTEHLRNLYLARGGTNLSLIEATDETRKLYADEASHFSAEDILRMLHIVSEAQFKIRDAHQPRIFFEITILKLIHLERIQGLKALMEEIQAIKEQGFTIPFDSKPAPEQQSKALSLEVDESEVDSQQEELEQDETEEPASAVVNDPSNETPIAEKDDADPAPAGKESAAPEPPSPQTPEPPKPAPSPLFNQDSLFGAPAIQDSKKKDTEASLGGVQTMNASFGINTAVAVAHAEPLPGAVEVSLELIQEKWDLLRELASKNISPVFSQTLLRTQVTEFQDDEITISSQDAFVEHTIKEAERELRQLFRTVFRKAFRINYEIRKLANEPEPEDNFSRFQKLIKSNSKLGALVETFGAEPEY